MIFLKSSWFQASGEQGSVVEKSNGITIFRLARSHENHQVNFLGRFPWGNDRFIHHLAIYRHIELLVYPRVLCSLTNMLISWGLTHKYGDTMGFDRHKLWWFCQQKMVIYIMGWSEIYLYNGIWWEYNMLQPTNRQESSINVVLNQPCCGM